MTKSDNCCSISHIEETDSASFRQSLQKGLSQDAGWYKGMKGADKDIILMSGHRIHSSVISN